LVLLILLFAARLCIIAIVSPAVQAGVPLIQQLKSDAIRKGHWEELMTLAEVETVRN
jgi:hypothetical protein